MRKLILVIATVAISCTAPADGGFTVTQYNLNGSISSVVAAKSAIHNSSTWRGSPVTKQYSRIAFKHGLPPPVTPHFQASMVTFPASVPGGTTGGMVLEIYGMIYIPCATNWTFACGSDDGFEMKISGNGISESFAYIGERALDTSFKTISIPVAGEYAIEIIYFDNYFSVEYDAAVLEVSIAEGEHAAFSSSFKLLRAASSMDTSHDVIFNANDGTGEMVGQVFEGNDRQKLSKNTYHKEGYVFQGWAKSIERAASSIVDFVDEQEITVDSDLTLYAVWKFQNAQVVVNFKKEDTELDLSCDNAYWRCDDHGGYTTFPIKSGEAFAMPAGTYTIKLYSGDTAFADPAPIQIVVDGTEGRIERDVVISRKKVWFSCVFYNQSNKENGMQPVIDEMDLNHFCWWRLDGGEWLREKIVQVPTGTHGLELRVEDHISLMVGMETFAKTIVLDGTETSHTEYINALGVNGAKVSFRFNGHTVHEWEGSPVFDESRVLIRLRSMRGQMCLHAGEYILPQGSYTASFEYDAQGGNSAWSSPYDMSFNINGIDKSFVLNFIDNEEGHYRVNVWFDGNGGTVDTPLLSYAVGYVSENPLLNPTPNPRRAGYKFIGWYSSKKDGREISVFLPTRDDPGIEYVEVSGEDDNINGKLAIHLYARWKEIKMTSTWLSWFPSFFSASDGDVATAASMTAANGCRTLDECYELGIDPEDPEDDLKIAEFKMKDGKPEITLNHTKDGSGNSFEDRVKILGKAELTDAEWQEVPPEGNPAHRFFTVDVEMP